MRHNSWQGTWPLVIVIALACGGPGCAADGDDDTDAGDAGTDTGSETGTATDSDSESETGSGSDTGPEPVVCDGSHDWDPADYDYGVDYPAGPYGFKGSMCWQAPELGDAWYDREGSWTEWGDRMHDVCLPNQDDVEICVHDYLRSGDYDVVMLDISAYWCAPCRRAAESEKAFVEELAEAGWRILWLTVLVEDSSGGPPFRELARDWRNISGIDGDVLYDEAQAWRARAISDAWPAEERGYPSFFLAHTSNLLVWDSWSGWPDTTDAAGYTAFKEWLEGHLDELATQPGAVEPDTDTAEPDTDTATDSDSTGV